MNLYVNLITCQRKLRYIVNNCFPRLCIVYQGTGRLSVIGGCAGGRSSVFRSELYEINKAFDYILVHGISAKDDNRVFR